MYKTPTSACRVFTHAISYSYDYVYYICIARVGGLMLIHTNPSFTCATDWNGYTCPIVCVEKELSHYCEYRCKIYILTYEHNNDGYFMQHATFNHSSWRGGFTFIGYYYVISKVFGFRTERKNKISFQFFYCYKCIILSQKKKLFSVF